MGRNQVICGTLSEELLNSNYKCGLAPSRISTVPVPRSIHGRLEMRREPEGKKKAHSTRVMLKGPQSGWDNYCIVDRCRKRSAVDVQQTARRTGRRMHVQVVGKGRRPRGPQTRGRLELAENGMDGTRSYPIDGRSRFFSRFHARPL